MKMKKCLLCIMACLGVIANSLAQESDKVPSAQTITKAVIRAAQSYADSLGCAGSIEPSAIAALVPWKKDTLRENAKYAAIWYGDIGCQGGSGTTTANIAIVNIGSGNTFYVDPARSSPQISFETANSRIGVSRILGNTKNTLTLEGFDYAENDAMCCPSIRKQFTVRSDSQGNWHIIQEKILPPMPQQ
ncbi:MAG: hypothetical protein NC211_06110 [Alistipes senegalensis]|nr:hypothetical protein [Oxalobacter formigenes]MCM1281387.1 hypothetical protein [Alistipes senegalensis]